MRVIPVLDLARGQACWGRAGARESYVPVRSVLIAVPGDVRGLVTAYRDALGCDECYVADLDALAGGEVQREVLRDLAKLGSPPRLLVDASITTPERARNLLADGVDRVVVGLETLPSFDALAAITHAVGPARVIFSLDLRNGGPLGAWAGDQSLVELTGRAIAAGASGLLLLDLARIGSRGGVDLGVVESLRRTFATVELFAGGGVATLRQLEQLADIGVDATLVGTALHDGSLSAPELRAIRHRGHSSDSR